MGTPFFSVVIPTLNEKRYLPRLLRSLVSQKNKDFEVIIVDGDSQDETEKIALEFKDELFLNFFKTKKKNVSFQRNFGAKKASGKYLIFFDADCEVNRSFIKNLKKIIENKKGLLFIPSVTPERGETHYNTIFNVINLLIELSLNFKRPFSSGGWIIIEKHFFKLLGGFDEKLFTAEDHELVLRASRWGVRAKFLSNLKVRVSLRRIKKEGELTLFYKYLIASVKYLTAGSIREKIFDYQMGGQFYRENKKKKNKEELLKKYLKQTKGLFKKLLAG